MDRPAERDVRLGLAHVHAPTEDMLRRSGLLEKLGADRIFPSMDVAVAWAGGVDAPGPVDDPSKEKVDD
jgi:hypothetical protein